MNQILISEKVYVTREMKRKRKIYKTLYIISVLTVIVLLLYYIVTERNKIAKEGLSHEILEQIINDNTIIEERTIVVALDNNADDEEAVQIQPIVEEPENEEPPVREVTTSDGQNYETEAVLTIPKLGISYPVLTEESEELLKVSLCKYCVVGHNYKNGTMFGKLSMTSVGDEITLKDLSGKTITYSINNKYVVEPTDVSCTSQLTNGQRELTLITCTDYGKRRLVVKAREL